VPFCSDAEWRAVCVFPSPLPQKILATPMATGGAEVGHGPLPPFKRMHFQAQQIHFSYSILVHTKRALSCHDGERESSKPTVLEIVFSRQLRRLREDLFSFGSSSDVRIKFLTAAVFYQVS